MDLLTGRKFGQLMQADATEITYSRPLQINLRGATYNFSLPNYPMFLYAQEHGTAGLTDPYIPPGLPLEDIVAFLYQKEISLVPPVEFRVGKEFLFGLDSAFPEITTMILAILHQRFDNGLGHVPFDPIGNLMTMVSNDHQMQIEVRKLGVELRNNNNPAFKTLEQLASIFQMIEKSLRFRPQYIQRGSVYCPPSGSKGYEEIAAFLQTQDLQGELVIDLGCGSGQFLIELADQMPETRFLGIDRQELAWSKMFIPLNLTFQQGDILSATLPQCKVVILSSVWAYQDTYQAEALGRRLLTLVKKKGFILNSPMRSAGPWGRRLRIFQRVEHRTREIFP